MFNVWEGMVINRFLVEKLRLNYLQEKGYVICTHPFPPSQQGIYLPLQACIYLFHCVFVYMYYTYNRLY